MAAHDTLGMLDGSCVSVSTHPSEIPIVIHVQHRRETCEAAMNDRDSTYADKLLGDALRLVTAGVDPELGAETVADALAALAKQAKALRAVEYNSEKIKVIKCECGLNIDVPLPNAESLAKTMAQTAKMIDETARLVQFCSGKSDSRPDLGGLPVDVLKALTDVQLRTVMDWVEANGQHEDIPERGESA